MAAAWIVEAVDIFEDRNLGLAPRVPCPAPDQFGLDGFEEGFDGGVEAPIFVKLPFGRFWVGRAGCRFHERCSVLGSE